MAISTEQPYQKLQRTYAGHVFGAPESQTFIDILKFYFEPEEATLAARMAFQPEPEAVIARRAGVPLEEASELLTKMSSKMFIIGFRRPDGTRTFRLKIIAAGDGEIECAGKTTRVGPGAVMYCAGNTLHGITNTGKVPLTFTRPAASRPITPSTPTAMASTQARRRPVSPMLTQSETAPMVQKLVLLTTAPMTSATAKVDHRKND